MRHLAWLAAVLIAFVAGVLAGAQLVDPGPDARPWERPRPSEARIREPSSRGREFRDLPDSKPSARAGEARVSELRARAGAPTGAADWNARLVRLDALVRGGEAGAAEALRTSLLDEVLAMARAGEGERAAQRLAAYLGRNPHDGRAHLLDSDLRQMRGNTDAALTPLFEVLAFADAPALVTEARERLELLVNVRESQLAARGDLPGLIRFLERVSAGDPRFDGHRLRLARWQLHAGRLEAADRTLAETGSVGIEPQARDDLAAAVALAREGLPFEREAGADGNTSALHVRAQTRAGPLRLLVDTGATHTVISRQRAEALGSRATGQWVQVRTAGGPVTAEVHRLQRVEIGALRLAALEVLVLDEALPGDVDGLLGMDVLGRLPNAGGAAPGSRP